MASFAPFSWGFTGCHGGCVRPSFGAMDSMSEEQTPDVSDFLPMPYDPRILVTVPRAGRARLEVLWSLAERLTKLLEDAREPLIGQIKLAWWRDMLSLLATNADALPKGEPLLAQLQQYWRGEVSLEGLVDAAEALMLAESDAERRIAAVDFGNRLFTLTSHCLQDQIVAPPHAAQHGAGARWGLLWAAYLYRGGDEMPVLLDAAAKAKRPGVKIFGAKGRALMMLDRLAGQIAVACGVRDYRREGLILLRIGLFGR